MRNRFQGLEISFDFKFCFNYLIINFDETHFYFQTLFNLDADLNIEISFRIKISPKPLRPPSILINTANWYIIQQLVPF
jgi:hypothetical protein